jgi:hypothetical protein
VSRLVTLNIVLKQDKEGLLRILDRIPTHNWLDYNVSVHSLRLVEDMHDGVNIEGGVTGGCMSRGWALLLRASGFASHRTRLHAKRLSLRGFSTSGRLDLESHTLIGYLRLVLEVGCRVDVNSKSAISIQGRDECALVRNCSQIKH